MNKKFIFPVFIVLMGAVVLVVSLYDDLIIDKRLPVGSSIPKFELHDLNTKGKIVPASMKGKVLFINFWASWCKPCIEEMLSLNNLNNILKNNDSFKMITIVYNDDPAECNKFLKKSGYDLPVYFDPSGEAAALFGITAVPETFIIDKTGKIAHVKIGPDRWDDPDKIKFVMSLLDM